MTSPLFCPPSTFRTLYIGKPGKFVPFPVKMPDAGISAPLTRSIVAHGLASGGTTTTKRRSIKRNYSVSWTAMTSDESNPLILLFAGQLGVGPYVLLDPRQRNVLSVNASGMGANVGGNDAWHSTSATDVVAYDGTQVAPVTGSGVVRWTNPGNTHQLWAAGSDYSASPFIPDPLRAVPLSDALSVVLSIYLKTSSATRTISLRAYGANPGNNPVSNTNVSQSCTVTTSWQRFTLALTAAQLPQSSWAYVVPALVTTDAIASDVLLAGAQIEYGVSAARAWQLGLGVPRVTVQDPLGDSSDLWWRTDRALTLSEV